MLNFQEGGRPSPPSTAPDPAPYGNSLLISVHYEDENGEPAHHDFTLDVDPEKVHAIVRGAEPRVHPARVAHSTKGVTQPEGLFALAQIPTQIHEHIKVDHVDKERREVHIVYKESDLVAVRRSMRAQRALVYAQDGGVGELRPLDEFQKMMSGSKKSDIIRQLHEAKQDLDELMKVVRRNTKVMTEAGLSINADIDGVQVGGSRILASSLVAKDNAFIADQVFVNGSTITGIHDVSGS